MGQRSFEKYFEFNNFSEIIHSDMTRLRTESLYGFIQCQYTRTILRKKNIEQCLFQKHSKFLNFDEIFHCGMTRLRNTILNYCCLCQKLKPKKVKVKVIKAKKVIRPSPFKNHLKFQNFTIHYSFLL